MKIKYLAIAAMLAILFVGCSSSGDEEDNTDKEFIIDGAYVPGMKFENIVRKYHTSDTNIDLDEVKKLKELIGASYVIKDRVIDIEETTENTVVSLSYNVITTKTINLINKTDCEITESVDYESDIYDAIKHNTVIKFEHTISGIGFSDYKESLTVNELIIGKYRYNLFDYTYYNTAYEVDILSGRKSLKNDRTTTEKYTYKIIEDKLIFYDSEGKQSFTAIFSIPYLKLDNGDLYKVTLKE